MANDTLTLYSVPVFERARTPIFLEDWRSSIGSTAGGFSDPPRRPSQAGRTAGAFDAGQVSPAAPSPPPNSLAGIGRGSGRPDAVTGKLHQEFGIAAYQGDCPTAC
jgi:hypothetical protein